MIYWVCHIGSQEDNVVESFCPRLAEEEEISSEVKAEFKEKTKVNAIFVIKDNDEQLLPLCTALTSNDHFGCIEFYCIVFCLFRSAVNTKRP